MYHVFIMGNLNPFNVSHYNVLVNQFPKIDVVTVVFLGCGLFPGYVLKNVVVIILRAKIWTKSE